MGCAWNAMDARGQPAGLGGHRGVGQRRGRPATGIAPRKARGQGRVAGKDSFGKTATVQHRSWVVIISSGVFSRGEMVLGAPRAALWAFMQVMCWRCGAASRALQPVAEASLPAAEQRRSCLRSRLSSAPGRDGRPPPQGLQSSGEGSGHACQRCALWHLAFKPPDKRC